MQFIKKNYEKVLLGLVFCGLMVAVGFMLFKVSDEKQKLDDLRNTYINRPVKPLAQPTTDRFDHVIRMVNMPIALDFSSTNRLFNPVRWVKLLSSGQPVPILPGKELEKLEVVKMIPLYLAISLDAINVTDSGARYGITIEQQAAAKPASRGKRTFYVSKGEKKEQFTLRDVKGPPDNPTELVLELPDFDQPVSVAKEKPFRRVDGYMADLKFTPENRTFPSRRPNDPTSGKIVVSGEQYNIVAISENEVVLSAPNGKKYTIRYSSAP